jgi:tetratricopeptide (TPR) repeat protein
MENRKMRNFNPRQTMMGVALMAGAMLAGSAVPAAAQTQSRMRVLVPSFVNAAGESTREGNRLADQVREQIDQMPTHAPVEEKEWKNALKQFGLKESDMDCIKWRQLAAQADFAQLVLCGTLNEAGQVSASFHPLAGGDAFDVPQFAFQDPETSAGQVVQSFQTYVRQISLVLYCDQNIQSQNWQGALDLCNQAVELNPRSVSAHYARGSALMNLDRLEEAFEAYRTVLEIEPLHTDAMLAAGILASRLGRADVSQQYFKEYLDLNPGDENVRLSIAHDLANAGDPAGALLLVEEAATSPEASASMLEYAGHFAMNAGLRTQQDSGPANGNTDAALPFFEKALQYYGRSVEMKGDSADPTVLRNMMLAYKNVGNQEQALAMGARATANSEDAQTWLVYSDVLREAERIDEAVRALDRAAQLDPTLDGIATRKVTMLMAEGQIDEAVAAVKAGLAANTLQADHAENIAQQIAVRGYNVTQDGRPEAAIAFFTAAREIGKSERTIGMINFFNGYALVRQADAILREATTAAPARRAMPMLERAKVMLEGAAAYTEQAAQRANLLENVRQYTEMAKALIDMG